MTVSKTEIELTAEIFVTILEDYPMVDDLRLTVDGLNQVLIWDGNGVVDFIRLGKIWMPVVTDERQPSTIMGRLKNQHR
jgi:hypothetical protein